MGNTHSFLGGICCAVRQPNRCPSGLRSCHFPSQPLHGLTVDVEYLQAVTRGQFGLEVAGHLESLREAQSVPFRGVVFGHKLDVLTIWPKPMKA